MEALARALLSAVGTRALTQSAAARLTHLGSCSIFTTLQQHSAAEGSWRNSSSSSVGGFGINAAFQRWLHSSSCILKHSEKPGWLRPKPIVLSNEEQKLRTRIILATLRSAEQPLTSQDLYNSIQQHPNCAIKSRHHFKKIIKRLKENQWIKPRAGTGPKVGGHVPFVFTVTQEGMRVPLHDEDSRQLRVARERATDMKMQEQQGDAHEEQGQQQQQQVKAAQAP